MSLTAKKRLKNPANHSRYGIHLSEETKRKISLHHKKYYENPENHPMYGKKQLEEIKTASMVKNTLIKQKYK